MSDEDHEEREGHLASAVEGVALIDSPVLVEALRRARSRLESEADESMFTEHSSHSDLSAALGIGTAETI